jgi:hypothetical protein
VAIARKREREQRLGRRPRLNDELPAIDGISSWVSLLICPEVDLPVPPKWLTRPLYRGAAAGGVFEAVQRSSKRRAEPSKKLRRSHRPDRLPSSEKSSVEKSFRVSRATRPQ